MIRLVGHKEIDTDRQCLPGKKRRLGPYYDPGAVPLRFWTARRAGMVSHTAASVQLLSSAM